MQRQQQMRPTTPAIMPIIIVLTGPSTSDEAIARGMKNVGPGKMVVVGSGAGVGTGPGGVGNGDGAGVGSGVG
jgi:hypothetical protein